MTMSERRCARCGHGAHIGPCAADLGSSPTAYTPCNCDPGVPEERREGERRVRSYNVRVWSTEQRRMLGYQDRSGTDRRGQSPSVEDVGPVDIAIRGDEPNDNLARASAGGDTLVERLAVVVAAQCDGAGCDLHRPCRHCINAARRSVHIVADELATRGEHQVVEILRTEASR